jgi:hypothetical protein
MTYVKINEQLYPASIKGSLRDTSWGNRDSKAITLQLSYEEVKAIFVDDVSWEILYQVPDYVNEAGETVTQEMVAYDNSEYAVAGPITDNRDGTVTVKMGKLTAEELLAIIQEAL